ncbi:hypothetical protein H7I53_18160 [Mycolicibacterium pulveris]|uniref:Uncharacterized protein n=1 Tax=Mycolicibacterium pulveris TaxID=36813 RepID=A0A7I7URW2_MYCPV|nr:hypothetical protein [Mycolicibacterium pulveris]MCV6982140.1 hypothetical protein [Mycolicibacterium pulveris]BBY78905.1 hypothetical protein MPUL_00630 [Mycolicibacterium pulveris]BBY84215.1 hypothetical protein MPUL_53730 [Mycolicibacterium pulveris]
MSAPRRFRKKPVEIEAWQLPEWDKPNWFDPDSELVFDVGHYVDTCVAIAEWCGGTSHMMCNADEQAHSGCHQVGPHILIPTLEGVMVARPGDYIIKGVQGEFYPCKPAIFEATYDRVGTA